MKVICINHCLILHMNTKLLMDLQGYHNMTTCNCTFVLYLLSKLHADWTLNTPVLQNGVTSSQTEQQHMSLYGCISRLLYYSFDIFLTRRLCCITPSIYLFTIAEDYTLLTGLSKTPSEGSLGVTSSQSVTHPLSTTTIIDQDNALYWTRSNII